MSATGRGAPKTLLEEAMDTPNGRVNAALLPYSEQDEYRADYHAGGYSEKGISGGGIPVDDLPSASESGAGGQGRVDSGYLQSERLPGGASDFDIRNNFNANFLYALPVGKRKAFLKNAPIWLDEAVGGWQVSTILRYSTPLPSAVQGDLAYNTNTGSVRWPS